MYTPSIIIPWAHASLPPPLPISGISIGLAVSAVKHTDRQTQTTERAKSIEIGRMSSSNARNATCNTLVTESALNLP